MDAPGSVALHHRTLDMAVDVLAARQRDVVLHGHRIAEVQVDLLACRRVHVQQLPGIGDALTPVVDAELELELSNGGRRSPCHPIPRNRSRSWVSWPRLDILLRPRIVIPGQSHRQRGRSSSGAGRSGPASGCPSPCGLTNGGRPEGRSSGAAAGARGRSSSGSGPFAPPPPPGRSPLGWPPVGSIGSDGFGPVGRSMPRSVASIACGARCSDLVEDLIHSFRL